MKGLSMFNYMKYLLGTRCVRQEPTPFACFFHYKRTQEHFTFSIILFPLSLSKLLREQNLLRNAGF